jgi:hypothetical protein
VLPKLSNFQPIPPAHCDEGLLHDPAMGLADYRVCNGSFLAIFIVTQSLQIPSRYISASAWLALESLKTLPGFGRLALDAKLKTNDNL